MLLLCCSLLLFCRGADLLCTGCSRIVMLFSPIPQTARASMPKLPRPSAPRLHSGDPAPEPREPALLVSLPVNRRRAILDASPNRQTVSSIVRARPSRPGSLPRCRSLKSPPQQLASSCRPEVAYAFLAPPLLERP